MYIDCHVENELNLVTYLLALDTFNCLCILSTVATYYACNKNVRCDVCQVTTNSAFYYKGKSTLLSHPLLLLANIHD